MSPKHRKRTDPILPVAAAEGIAPPPADVDVNPEVDTPWELVENEDLSGLVAEGVFKIRMLAKVGHASPTEEALNSIRRDPNEFGGLLQAVTMTLKTPRHFHHLYTEKGKGKAEGMYEFKRMGKQARLFFFYGSEYGQASDLLISTSGYFKGKSSRDEQNRAFCHAASIRDEFLASEAQRHG